MATSTTVLMLLAVDSYVSKTLFKNILSAASADILPGKQAVSAQQLLSKFNQSEFLAQLQSLSAQSCHIASLGCFLILISKCTQKLLFSDNVPKKSPDLAF